MPREKWATPIGILIALGIAVLGFLLGRTSVDVPDSSPPDEPRSESPGPGPTSLVNGVPVGYAASHEGAATAAYEFSRVMAAASADEADYVARLRTLAAPDWRDRAEELARNSTAFVKRQYGPGGFITFHPLRYRVVEISSEDATVEIWGVALAARTSGAAVEESWLLGEVSLSWVGGDWRVSGQTSEPGPTPRMLQSTEGPSFDRLEGFEEYGVVSGL